MRFGQVDKQRHAISTVERDTTADQLKSQLAMISIEKKTSRDEAPETIDSNPEQAPTEYVEGLPLVCIIVGLTLAVFCLALVRSSLTSFTTERCY